MRLGVDEAGKGPVLGAMFAAAVRVESGDLPPGVADSKSLSAGRRRELARAIRETADAVAVAEIPVARIDDPGTDMNGLTVTAHADALGTVARDGDRAYADAGDTNAARFERNVAGAVPVDLDLRAEHRADESHPVVSAASIVAKVERDAHVATLAAEYGDLGSGYPGDETTRAFLRRYVAEHGGLPDCARESWQTSREIVAAAEQSSLGEFQ
jgi:ribonuclease HII